MMFKRASISKINLDSQYRLLTKNCMHFVESIVGETIKCKSNLRIVGWLLDRLGIGDPSSCVANIHQAYTAYHTNGTEKTFHCQVDDMNCTDVLFEKLATTVRAAVLRELANPQKMCSFNDILRMTHYEKRNPNILPSIVNVIVLDIGPRPGHLCILLNSTSNWCSIGLNIETRNGKLAITTQIAPVPSFVATPDPLLFRAVKKGIPIRVVSVSPLTRNIRRNIKLILKDSIPLQAYSADNH
jgi:hypothetical protein